MEEYIKIIEDLICEFHQSDEKERYEQAKALEKLLKEYREEKRRRVNLIVENENICDEVNKNFIRKDRVGGIISHLLMGYPVDNYYEVRKETSQNIIDELRRY